MEIPDDLYRRVKAKSAMQGHPVREIAVHLFQQWIEDANIIPIEALGKPETTALPEWYGIAGRYAKRVRQHDIATIRHNISLGRAQNGEKAKAQ